MKTHNLKCEPPFFEDVTEGRKPFEVRRNDRGYRVGDVLRLHRFTVEEGYTPDTPPTIRHVSYMLEGVEWGLRAGFCVLGLTTEAPA